jgi:hypothetical protein
MLHELLKRAKEIRLANGENYSVWRQQSAGMQNIVDMQVREFSQEFPKQMSTRGTSPQFE